jgi:hypothetical protein
MPFNSQGTYVANHKTWDHVGNVIPVVEHSEGIRPHGEFKPAAWLPVQFFDKYFEDWYVVMPGKLLAFDTQGRVVPAEYAVSGCTITYTTDDVAAGVIDVRTGAALLANATGTFAVSGVTDMMGTGEALAISKPVGVAPYAFWQWAGDGQDGDTGFNPAHFRKHNYNQQHRVAILCDYVLEVPLVPLEATEERVSGVDTGSVITYQLAHAPVAKNTMRTAFAFADDGATDSETAFVNQVELAADLAATGDWHIDYTTGVLSVYKASTLGANEYKVTYFHYDADGDWGAEYTSGVSKFACALGNLKPGDFVKVGQGSNFAFWDEATDDVSDLMGQVLEVEDLMGKDYLDRVRTAFDPALGTSATGTLPGYSGQLDQMPGSATGGVPDKVHYAGAANLVVRINLISR